jgi:hypothetical protein
MAVVMAKNTYAPLTRSEALKLSLDDLDEHIASTRTELHSVKYRRAKLELLRQLRMLESVRTKKKEGLTHSNAASLISTINRAPLWKATGYPASAIMVSEALTGVPQYKSLQLQFLEIDRLSERGGRPLRVLEGSYYSHRGGISFPRFNEVRWDISVRAVRRDIKKPVSTALNEKGLPRLRKWLLDMGDLESREGRAGIEFSFDDHNELLVKESKQLLPGSL